MTSQRQPDHPVHPIFLQRWSPRAFDGSVMPEADLLSILEAGRWAPSAYNIQPWTFLYSRKGDESWGTFQSYLDEFNQTWAHAASALIFVLSDAIMPGEGERPDKPSPYHSFDTGAAWAQIALQASTMGYSAHAMAGIHFDRIRTGLSIPERYKIEIAVAVGKRADASILAPDLQAQERPSDRRALREMAHAGGFPA